MITLYESILSSTKTGKDDCMKRTIPQKSKYHKDTSTFEWFEVDMEMQKWINLVDENNFRNVFDNAIYKLRKVRGKRYIDDVQSIGIFFRDGYLEVRLSQSCGPNKFIRFGWYFASEPKVYKDKLEAIHKNWDVIEKLKGDKNSPTTLNYLYPTYSRKEVIEEMHKFMKAYIKYTPKQ
jgi:hypothetical protein